MQIVNSFRSLFFQSRRSLISGGPSYATAELQQAWETPLVRYYSTPQPYAGPLSIFGGNGVLNGETSEMRREYREWSFREPPVKAALLTKCFAVASLDPQVKADEPKDARSKEVAVWVDYALTHAQGGLVGLIQNMLLPGCIDGFSVNEPVWDVIESGRYRGFWAPKRYAMIDSESLRFKLDPYRQIIGVRPMTGTMGGWQELPPEDFIIFTHLKLFENPFGISDFRAIVRDCRLIEAAIKMRQVLLNNFSGPFLVGKSGSDGVRRSMAQVLQRARESGFIVIPADAEVTVLNLATSNPQVFDTVIQSYRENIVSAIQGGYLQLLEGGVTDGRGNTNVHKNIAQLFQWWLASWACEVINHQHIPRIVRPNFGNDVGLPTLSLGGIDEAVISAALDRFKRGQELGVPLSIEQVTTVGGFELPNGQEDTLVPPQQQQQPGGGIDPNSDPFGLGSDTPGGNGGGTGWQPGASPTSGQTGYVNENGTFRRNDPTQQMSAHLGGFGRTTGIAGTFPRAGGPPTV